MSVEIDPTNSNHFIASLSEKETKEYSRRILRAEEEM
jgi:hypothetical protein